MTAINKAKEAAIVEKHGGLVRSIAQKIHHPLAEEDDLVQDGFIGLIEAHRRYKKVANAKFTTFAYYWIKKMISYELVQNWSFIRIPRNTRAMAKKYVKLVREGMDPKKALDAVCKSKQQHQLLRDALRAYGTGASLSYEALQVACPADGPPELVENEDVRAAVRGVMKECLTPKEFRVVNRRYGVRGPSQTFREIAESMGVTRQYVQQVHNKAVDKLCSEVGMKLN